MTRTDYQRTANALRAIHNKLEAVLRRNRELAHRGMWQAGPCIWISNDFSSVTEALDWLKSQLP